ncbi:MAG: hypothetical protein ABMA64_21260, partial [Myxococcota bacterium]
RAGDPVPFGGATQLVVAPGDLGNNLLLTVRVDVDTDALAVLWPMAGIAPTSAVPLGVDEFGRLEQYTAPRVESLRCDELVQITHWPTPPGCASYDYRAPPPPRGEDAMARIGEEPVWSSASLYVDVFEPDELEPFLTERGLTWTEAVGERLLPHLEAGEPVLVIMPLDPVQAGTWLSPVHFVTPAGPVSLPLTLGAAESPVDHVLEVYGVTDAAGDDLQIENFPSAPLAADCVLPEDQTAAEALDAMWFAASEASPLPVWTRTFAQRGDTCSPCTGPAPTPFDLSVLGVSGGAQDSRIGRVRLTYAPTQLDEDPVVSFGGGAADTDIVLLAYEPGLAFAFPTCGSDGIDADAAACPDVDLAPAGCAAAPRGLPPLVLAALLLAGRRRWGPAAAIGLVLALSAPAARAGDPHPATELAAGLALVGTDRIVPAGLDHGAPWVGNPMLAVEFRRSLWGWRAGRTVGLLGAAHGLIGHAAPWGARRPTSFTLIEPWLGLDVRHGRLREASPLWFGRYGVDLVVAFLDSSAAPPQTTPSGGLHAGVGKWLGRGASRTAVELRATLVGRTDGYETTFHPNLDARGWMYYPGEARVWLMIGRVSY